jgi:hypothetical protein
MRLVAMREINMNAVGDLVVVPDVRLREDSAFILRSLVCALILGLFTAGCLVSRDEIARVRSPSGDVDGVAVETNGGAATSFGYEVYVVPKSRSTFWRTKVGEAVRRGQNQQAYGVNLKWRNVKTLAVEYLHAESAEMKSGATISVGGSAISVILAGGINDPRACPGGMLYDIQMSNIRGRDCAMIRR